MSFGFFTFLVRNPDFENSTTMSGQSLRNTLGNIIFICQATGISLLTEWIEKKQDAHDMEIERQVDELLILQENEGY